MSYSIAGVASQAETVLEQYLKYTADLAELEKQTCSDHEEIQQNENYKEHCRSCIERLGNVQDAAEVLRKLDVHSDVLVKYQAKQYASLRNY